MGKSKFYRKADELKAKFIKSDYCTLNEFATRVGKSVKYIQGLSAKDNWISDKDAYAHNKKSGAVSNLKDRKIILDRINARALERLEQILDQEDAAPDLVEKAIAIGLQYTQQKPTQVIKNEIGEKNENASNLYRTTIQQIKSGLGLSGRISSPLPEPHSDSSDN